MRQTEKTVSALHQATPIRSSGREPLRNGQSHLTLLAPLEAQRSSCCVSGPRTDEAPLPLPTPHSLLLPFCPFPPPIFSPPLLCIHTKSLQLCLTLCDPMDCSLPGSSVHGILQARITGVGCHALLQEIVPTQGLNPHLLCLLHWWVGSLPLAPPGKPCPPSIVPSYSARDFPGGGSM